MKRHRASHQRRYPVPILPAPRRWHPPVPPVRNGGVAARLRRRLALAGLLACTLFALPVQPLVAEPAGDAIRAQQSGNLLLRMQDGYRVATRLNTDVDMAISGIVARVTVSQVFRNDGADWVEGVYVFPLPEGAAVDRMRLRAGERLIVGEIREKDEAKKAYEQARAEGRRASLVGQQRANLFTTRIANIAPGETVTIEIGYLDAVRFDDNAFSLRFPMTLTPRYIPGRPLADRQGSGWSPDTTSVPDASDITPPVVTSSPDHRVTLTATIDAGMPLELVASRYHPIEVSDTRDGYRVTLRQQEVSDHDFELVWRPVVAAAPRALLFDETVGDQQHLLLMLVPPPQPVAAKELPGRELTLVIDTSGSMHGTSIEQARRAVELALADLRPTDRFNLIEFNSVTRSLYPRPQPASGERVARATAWLRGLAANGGTEMRPALLRALQGESELPLRQVVFVTDGAVGNEAELFELIEGRLGDTRLFTVGIGSAPNGFFMREAAAAGRGTFVYISALHEVQEKMTRLLKRLRAPVLTDIELQWPDGVEALTYPQRVADLYSGEPVIVRARLGLAPRPGDQLIVRGTVAGGGWSAEVPIAKGRQNPGVAALWARARIAALDTAGRRGADADETRAGIVATALRYGLVSRFTSMIAVDRTPVRPADDALAQEQVPNLLPYGQSRHAIFGFPATATAGPLLRFTGAACLLLATLVALFRICNLAGPRRAAAA